MASDTETLAAGTSSTVTVAVAFFFWISTVMMATPFATPVTTPSAETVAIDALPYPGHADYRSGTRVSWV